MNTLSPQENSEELAQSPEVGDVPRSEVVALPSAFELVRQVLVFVQAHARDLFSILGVYVAGLCVPAAALGLAGFLMWQFEIVTLEVFSLLSFVVGAVFLVLFIIWSAVAMNALSYFVVKNGSVEGGVRGAVRMGLRLLIPGAWVSLLIMVSIFGGFMLFAVPGIFLLVVFLCAYSVFLAEDKRGVAALAQSWYYVQGRWWSVFVLQFTWFLLTWIVLFIGSMGVTFFATTFFGEKVGATLEEVVSGILNFMIGVLAFIYYYRIYVALRALKPEPMTEDAERSMRRRVYTALVVGTFGIIIFISLVVFLLSVAANSTTL